MKKYLKKLGKQFTDKGAWWKRWRTMVSVMAMVVVFITTYALILPAITLEKEEGKPEQGVYLDDMERGSTSSLKQSSSLADTAQNMEGQASSASEEEADGTRDEILSGTMGEDGEKSKSKHSSSASRNQGDKSKKEENLQTEYANGVYTGKGDGYTLSLDLKEEMRLPADVTVSLEEIKEDQDTAAVYRSYMAAAKRAAAREGRGEIRSVRFIKFALFSDGKEVRASQDIDILVEPTQKDTVRNGDEAHVLTFRGSAAHMLEDVTTQMSGYRVSTYRFFYPSSTVDNKNWGLLCLAVTEPKAGVASTEEAAAGTETGDEETAASTGTETGSTETATDADNGTEETTAEASEDSRKPAWQLEYQGEDFKVVMTCDDKAGIPEGAALQVTEIRKDKDRKKYKKYLQEASETLEMNKMANPTARFFDIKIMDGDQEIEPASPVSVNISYDQPMEVKDGEEVEALHFGDQKTEVIDNVEIRTNRHDDLKSINFEADSFSVYGVLVYTVDFHYAVNGKMYDFSIPGGSFVSLEHVVELLGIANTDTYSENEAKSAENGDKNTIDNAGEVSDISNITTYSAADLNALAISEKTRKFVADVESVTFSSPELVWVGKVDSDSTVGGLKEANGLECEYCAELTEEQIAEINAQTVEAGDWALISLKPFESEETLAVTMKNGGTFTIKVTDSQTTINEATVHYGYMEGNTFHEFTNKQFTPPTSGFGDPAYLIYDVPGYQYAGKTYYSSSATQNPNFPIYPILQDNQYTYKDFLGRERKGNVARNSHIYVTYEPRPAATQGGSSSQGGDYPDEPTVLKKSEVNPNTGTNTISLEISGPRKTTKPKADIIVIYDVSGSMMFPIGFNSLTDVQEGEDATKYFIKNPDDSSTTLPGHPEWEGQRNALVVENLSDLAEKLMGNNTGNDPAVRMTFVPFSTQYDGAQFLPFTDDPDTFNNRLNNLKLGGGTNWEDALQTANAMQVREDADTYVLFVTDGNPTFRITRLGETDDQLNDWPSGSTISYYNDYGIFGTGNSDVDKTSLTSRNNNLSAALAIAQSIVGKNKKLYGLGISDEADELEKLIQKSGSSGKYYSAKTNEGVTDAINDIRQQVLEKTFGYSDVKITDGITDLTQTVAKTGMTTLPASDDFEYFKGHAATQADVEAGKASAVGETVWEPWTAELMVKEGAGRASYNSTTGAVEWNLGEKFMLEDGVTYKVDFTVWPSQDAYDLLADLNNGVKDYNTLDGSVKAQIKKQGEGESATYTLKTNKDEETGNPAGYSYRKATKEGEDGEVTPNGDPIPHLFPEVIPLNLKTNKIGVKKDFSNLLDSRDPTQIQLELWGNRLYKTFTLTKDGQWKSDDNYISCGLLTVDKNTGTVYVYETGHDFTLKETGEDSIYWELTADTYHPMVINNELHMLSKTDAPQGMSADDKYYKDKDGDKEYYRIGDTVYVDEGTDAVLNAVNDHRSFLDLSKEVVDSSGNKVACEDYFNYKLKFNESRTNDDIIFTVYDTVNKKYISDPSITTAVLTPADDTTNTTPYFKVRNNTEFTLKIKQGWNVRFLNLSNGTTYTIEEVLDENLGYVFDKIEGSAEKKDKGGNSIATDTHMTISSGSKQMSGTIYEPNVLYSVKYTNKAPKKKIQILKTDQTGSTPLEGAEFSLYGSDYYDEDGQVNPDAQALKSNVKTNENGILDLGTYTDGTYYLVEEKAPEGYIKLAQPVKLVLSSSPSYEQNSSSLSVSGDGIKPLKDDNQKVIGYQFVVTNDAGYALPSTGGTGTGMLYLFGIILTGLAGAGLVMKKRRRNAA